MDTIVICDLEVRYQVGVPDAERAQPQRLLVTVEMEHNFSSAAIGDDLSQTVDYFAVSQKLLRFGEGRSWKLIEKLAEDAAQMLLSGFQMKSVSVEVKKFIIPEARYVSVRVRRDRQ